MIHKPIATACLALVAIVGAPHVRAQSVADLKVTVEKALAGNPELSARFHAFRAASDGVDAARAGRGPRLDLTGDVGRDRATFTATPRQTVDRSAVGLTLNQVLWDGLGSQREAERAGHERMSRYFELLEASEQTALEAARALYDVQRFRRLVALAEDSVEQHRQAAEKIQSRVAAGVGRGVDAEQAQARLALAESNLVTERANLHDVSARYQRVVGDAAPREAGALALFDAGIARQANEALRTALVRSPAISASIENLRAARAALQLREAQLQPRVEARLRTAAGHNVSGLDGRRTDSAAEVVMSWNLFDGGADRARVQQQANLLGQAMDLRDKTCRDVRQTALIAHNDGAKLLEQITLLERNTQAIERARDAYRQQFDIGQRSLLDLLNAENETYTARRALANARYDRAIALVRAHAALNQLNAQLGLARGGLPDEAPAWSAGDDGAARCPIQIVDAPLVPVALDGTR